MSMNCQATVHCSSAWAEYFKRKPQTSVSAILGRDVGVVESDIYGVE